MRIEIQSLFGSSGDGRDSVSRNRWAEAFTLIEVMVAMGIFFMAIFAILALVSTNCEMRGSCRTSRWMPARSSRRCGSRTV